MSSSSRTYPFSFSRDVRAILGPPGPINDAVRRALPSLFDGSVAALLRVTSEETRPPSVVVQAGCTVPAGIPVGLFSGHVFMGTVLRGDRVLALPPVRAHGVYVDLGVDASAALGRFPSPTQAGLYSHVCNPGTLVAEWREVTHVPSFPVLVAVTDRRLHENVPLCWNFDLHCVHGCYTLDDSDGQDWCADDGAVRECDCNAPHPCPRDRVLRAPLPEEDAASSEEDSWPPALGQPAHWTSATQRRRL